MPKPPPVLRFRDLGITPPTSQPSSAPDDFKRPYKAMQYVADLVRSEIQEAIGSDQPSPASTNEQPCAEHNDTDENAPWLTLAHIICADAGIPPGHITDRLSALRDKLEATAPSSELIDTPEFRELAGNWSGAAQSSDKFTRETRAKQAWEKLVTHVAARCATAAVTGSGSAAGQKVAVARVVGSDTVIGRERRCLEWAKGVTPFDFEPGTVLYAITGEAESEPAQTDMTKMRDALHQLRLAISYRAACLIEGNPEKIAYADTKLWAAPDKAGEILNPPPTAPAEHEQKGKQ